MRSVRVELPTPGKSYGLVVEIAAPVAGEIPVSAADVGHVSVDHQAELRGVHAGFLNATVAETEAGTHGADHGCDLTGRERRIACRGSPESRGSPSVKATTMG